MKQGLRCTWVSTCVTRVYLLLFCVVLINRTTLPKRGLPDGRALLLAVLFQ